MATHNIRCHRRASAQLPRLCLYTAHPCHVLLSTSPCANQSTTISTPPIRFWCHRLERVTSNPAPPSGLTHGRSFRPSTRAGRVRIHDACDACRILNRKAIIIPPALSFRPDVRASYAPTAMAPRTSCDLNCLRRIDNHRHRQHAAPQAASMEAT